MNKYAKNPFSSSKLDYRTLLRDAALELRQMRVELQESKQKHRAPIAIIGMGCRFPGGANDLAAYWALLRDGVDAIGEIPPSRWEVDAYYDADPAAPGKMYTRSGGFLAGQEGDVAQFDAQFFGISPREAVSMDPQQRLLLEVSWEAIEQAGIAAELLKGSRTGVFVGLSFSDYTQLSQNPLARLDAHSSLGSLQSIAAGRLAHFFDLHGPVMQLDTACSSSLQAIHLAMMSLRVGESDLALAGGVNLMLSPDATIGLCKLNALAPDGRCKTFDAAADGYGRGEGCGMVLLKRLSDALANNDPILAVIRGSAVNHDGRSNTLTAPNGTAQEGLLHRALENAQVEPYQIQYVEAHGTGTPLGDPIEVLALSKVLRPENPSSDSQSKPTPLMIGSAKSNIGHLEAAAGVAGLIKVVLSLQHGQIPPHLHFKTPNPYIPWQKLPLQVPTNATSWAPGRRLAGVSSFGMSGTNVHLIVEEASSPQITPTAVMPSSQLLTLSAKSKPALLAVARRYHAFLATHPDISLANLCFTSHVGRSHFDHRLAIIAGSTNQLRERLNAVINTPNTDLSGSISGEIEYKHGRKPIIAFLFTGQGSQYVDMGRQLYDTEPTFRATLTRCDELLRPLLDYSLLSILYPTDQPTNPPTHQPTNPPTHLLHQTAYTQPALFALEYALAELWRSWGIVPDVVMGHSLGELVAACVAGVFTLEEGLKLAAERGRLMQTLAEAGEMVALFASEREVKSWLADILATDDLSIAAINGPQHVVISGKRAAIRHAVQLMEAKGVKSKQLNVSHAFHSSVMDPIIDPFEQIARSISFNPPQIEVISNVTGQAAGQEIATAAYWRRHVREAVRFADGIKTLQQQDAEIVIEIGPQPVLLGMARRCVADDFACWLPSLHPNREREQLLSTLSALYVRGVKVDWARFHQHDNARRVSLPTYPFQRQRYWVSPDVPALSSQAKTVTQRTRLPLEQAKETDMAQLADQLADKLSVEERKLLPKLLKLLVEQQQEQKNEHGAVFETYNTFSERSRAFSAASETPFKERFLTFGPFPEVVPGFSWLLVAVEPHKHPQHLHLSQQSQWEIRDMLFSEVDFARVRNVLDFGCGYGSDLIALAQQHPHLKLCGYTISSEQAKIGAGKVERNRLGSQIQIFNRDSAKDAFPAHFDLIFGFEVAHHMKDKTLLFSNISQHLTEGGQLLLADFVSNAAFPIEHEETSSYFETEETWVRLLSEHQLELVKGVDISPEVANYLHDPDFEVHLAHLTAADQKNVAIVALQSYDQLGKLLRKQLASYVLLTIKKQSHLTPDELAKINHERLDALTPYAQLKGHKRLHNFDHQPPFDKLRERADGQNNEDQVQNPLIHRLQQAPASQRRDILIAHLQQEVGHVLGFNDSQSPYPYDLQQPFADMGMNSLMGLELVNRLQTAFKPFLPDTDTLNEVLPATLIFDISTMQELADYLGREVLGWGTGKEEDDLVGEDVMEDDDIDASIAEELAELERLLEG